MKRAASTPRRSRKKATEPESTASEALAPQTTATPAGSRNVEPLEGSASLAIGLLFVISALFPRSIKQLALLSLGGGLIYRGMTGHCGVYQALGIDTTKQPLLARLKL